MAQTLEAVPLRKVKAGINTPSGKLFWPVKRLEAAPATGGRRVQFSLVFRQSSQPTGFPLAGLRLPRLEPVQRLVQSGLEYRGNEARCWLKLEAQPDATLRSRASWLPTFRRSAPRRRTSSVLFHHSKTE